MKTQFKLLTILAIGVSLSACKKKDAELEVLLTSNSSYAIDTAAFSCTQLKIGVENGDLGEVSGRRMIWGKPKFIWKNKTKKLIIDQMAVVFISPNFGKYVYDKLDVVEINAMITGTTLGAVSGYNTSTGIIDAAPTTGNNIIQGQCELRAGSLAVKPNASSFRATGKLKVIGRSFLIDDTGTIKDEVPVFAEAILYIDYATF